jgi:rubrerythrin
MSEHNHDFTVSDLEYNVITTLSNLLQSEEVLQKYANDAEEAGDEELAQMFHNLREQNSQVATKLHEKLGRLIGKTS